MNTSFIQRRQLATQTLYLTKAVDLDTIYIAVSAISKLNRVTAVSCLYERN